MFSVGYYHPDEHHQLLEFAGLKLGLNESSDLPWEYHNQMRPTMQVYLVIWIYSFFKIFGLTNPFLIATVLRIISAAISFLAIHLFIKAFIPKIENNNLQLLFVIFSFLLWFNVFNNVRFSSENWSGTFFMIGFSLLHNANWRKGKHLFIIGLVLGFSFVFRFQVGLLILGLVAWLLILKRESLINIAFIILGILGAILMGIISDYVYYQEWTITFWNYLHQNIFLDKVSGFGTDPWWYYFSETFISGIPPFSLVFILAILLVFVFKPKSILTWTFLPFILVHCFISHKEVRFLFPIIGFLSLFMIESIAILKSRFIKDITLSKSYKISKDVFLAVNFIALAIIAFKPAENNIKLYKAIYIKYDQPATLFSIGDNPYLGQTKISFYSRPDLEIVEIDNLHELNEYETKTKLFVTRNKELMERLDKDHKIIFQALAEWVKKFNVNKWVERTRFWRVYEIE